MGQTARATVETLRDEGKSYKKPYREIGSISLSLIKEALCQVSIQSMQ